MNDFCGPRVDADDADEEDGAVFLGAGVGRFMDSWRVLIFMESWEGFFDSTGLAWGPM